MEMEQLVLKLKRKHNLSHIASDMITGPFGRSSGRGLVMVQSMDGMVTIMDQSDCLFTTTLPGFCLPGPMGYNPRTDTMVTVSSARQLEVYRYQSLLSHKNKTAKVHPLLPLPSSLSPPPSPLLPLPSFLSPPPSPLPLPSPPSML